MLLEIEACSSSDPLGVRRQASPYRGSRFQCATGECYDCSMAAQQVPPPSNAPQTERSQIRRIHYCILAGILLGLLVFRHYVPWNDDYIHPLAFFVYVIPLSFSIFLGAIFGILIWILSRFHVEGWSLRRETARPNEVRNALLAIVAICMVGWLLLTLLDSKDQAPKERPTERHPSEVPPPDNRGGLGELRSEPATDYTVDPGGGAPRP